MRLFFHKTGLTCDDCEFQGDVSKMKVHRFEMHDFPCDFCEFVAQHPEDMRKHKLGAHGAVCEFCELTCISEKKLSTHMCRKHVQNPDYMDLYVKNWFFRNSCIPVFSKRLKKDIVLLHSELC